MPERTDLAGVPGMLAWPGAVRTVALPSPLLHAENGGCTTPRRAASVKQGHLDGCCQKCLRRRQHEPASPSAGRRHRPGPGAGRIGTGL